jgi:hypothetical protein
VDDLAFVGHGGRVNGNALIVHGAGQIVLKIRSNVSGEKIKPLQWGAAWTTNAERYSIPGLMNGTTDMPSAENTSRAALIVEAENRLQFNVFVETFRELPDPNGKLR